MSNAQPNSTFTKQLQLILHGGLAAFAVYFCMYAFRKPFTVLQFEDLYLWGVHYKVILVISQVLGYASSKFFGIKFIAELKTGRRAFFILLFIGLAELALLGFALTPTPYNFFFLFLNGLPLGLIWGLVFSYLEGRKITEILSVILCASFILSSGAVKSVGVWLLFEQQVAESWMPFLTGLLFVVPLVISVWILERFPAPTQEDITLRTKREPMGAQERRQVFRQLAPGLVLLVLIYMLVTAFREFRDSFAVEIWSHLGYEGDAAVFTQSEIPIMFVVLILLGAFSWIRGNARAFQWMNVAIMVGLLLVGLSNLAFSNGYLKSPMTWMILVGMGLYIAYIPFNGMLFDRLIALFRFKGNAGYLIYIADAFGYLGSILILVYKEFFQQELSVYQFFVQTGYLLSGLGLFVLFFSSWYFRKKRLQIQPTAGELV